MFAAIKNFTSKGVIGLNERNIDYVFPNNPRKLMRLVNDKIETKRIAATALLPTPDLYGVISTPRELATQSEFLRNSDGFVIKPAQGSQGKGIIVVTNPLREGWRLANGRRLSLPDMRFQINNILSGMYSLGGQVDKAMIEYRVQFDSVFENISFKGVPDIRVIVYKGIPAFAMLRLPTSDSDGKANLHRGGVGVGVDIASGITQKAMQYDRLIDFHPDTGHPLAQLQTPYWDDILAIAARSYDVTGLGYIGVDIVLDRVRGPLLLELNGRPGISIQIANRRGMRAVLKELDQFASDNPNATERVAIARKLKN